MFSGEDIAHVVPGITANNTLCHWLYFKNGSVVQWNPATGQIISGRRLPPSAEIGGMTRP